VGDISSELPYTDQCAIHPTRSAVGVCTQCHRPGCEECISITACLPCLRDFRKRHALYASLIVAIGSFNIVGSPLVALLVPGFGLGPIGAFTAYLVLVVPGLLVGVDLTRYSESARKYGTMGGLLFLFLFGIYGVIPAIVAVYVLISKKGKRVCTSLHRESVLVLNTSIRRIQNAAVISVSATLTLALVIPLYGHTI